MLNVISLTAYGFILSIGQCDLIGYNRLGNNVHSHRRFRNGIDQLVMQNYQQQIDNWLEKQDGEVQPDAKLPENSQNNQKRQNRVNEYKRVILNYYG